ncbi:MAG: asparagine synthase (glutamine-hydrolyzing) [Coriobacteriia bacterium]|nr:asparagine synthase (glutamine-hydrolyzing) [Coriobacteriia bacterium]
MSGFTGFIDQKTDNPQTVVCDMLDKIKHRGPDGQDYYSNTGSNADSGTSIAMGVCHLQVTNEVPTMFNEDNSLVMAFSGRIFNYQELKDDLEKRGHKFQTGNDSEVVIHGYEEHQEQFFSQLRGMFSFVLYDIRKEELVGVRDPFGIKPFYYYHRPDTFLFSSEIKSFLAHPNFQKELNQSALKPYLSFQYSVLDETFFKDAYRLNPGEYLRYKEGMFEKHSYSELIPSRIRKDYHALKKELAGILGESVKLHQQISDVDIGGYLSGGVDSSYVVATAKPQQTFSIGFEAQGFDETELAKDLSETLGLQNFTQHLSGDDFFKTLPDAQYFIDEPHANLSIVLLLKLSKMTSKQVKIALTGEGADEMFGGYNEYRDEGMSALYAKLPLALRSFIGKRVESLPRFKGKNSLMRYSARVEDTYFGIANIMSADEANQILADSFKSDLTPADIVRPYYDKVKGFDDVAKKMFIDLNFWLPKDMLLKADKMSMANSVELRAPLLDKEVYNLASTISVSELIKDGETKHIFRDITRAVLPVDWAKRRKLGMPTPFAKWIREERYYGQVKEIFNQDFAGQMFNLPAINALLDDHYSGKRNNGRKIYVVYAFLIWYKVYFLK